MRGLPFVIVFILVAFVLLGFVVPALIESRVSLQKAKMELTQAEQERDLVTQNLTTALQTIEQLRQELEKTRGEIAETGTELVETRQERDVALQAINRLENELALLQQEPEQNHSQVQPQQKPELGKVHKQLLLGLTLGVGTLLLIGGLMIYNRHIAPESPVT